MVKRILNKIIKRQCIRCNKYIGIFDVCKFHDKFDMCIECYLLANYYETKQ